MNAVHSLLIVLLAVLASVVPGEAQLGRALQQRERRERRERGFDDPRTRRPRRARDSDPIADDEALSPISVTPEVTTLEADAPAPATDCPSILELVAGSDDLTTLAAALEAANLTAPLADPTTSVTVLAPTDDAFEQVPAGDLEMLLADPEALSEILGLHILEGPVMAEDLVDGSEADAMTGPLVVSTTDGVTFTAPNNGSTATVVDADILSCAGVVHKIDAVLVPGGP